MLRELSWFCKSRRFIKLPKETGTPGMDARIERWVKEVRQKMELMKTHRYYNFAPVYILPPIVRDGIKHHFYVQRSLRPPKEIMLGSEEDKYYGIPLDYGRLQEDLKTKGLEIRDPRSNWVPYKDPNTGKTRSVLIDFSRVHMIQSQTQK